MMIDSYTFGEIVIDGKKYIHDLIIYPSRIDDDWWRSESHELRPEDVEDIIKHRPDTLIVGLGASSCMVIKPETMEFLKKHSIKLIAEDTKKACTAYNELSQKSRVVAALHLTC